MPASLDGPAIPYLPPEVVPFPRGFAFAPDGRIFLASGMSPSGIGENTIKVFDADGQLLAPRLVDDSQLSPLDLTIAPNGNIVVSSEWPFGARDAISSVREYDSTSGRLVRIFKPDGSILFRNPRGLRFAQTAISTVSREMRSCPSTSRRGLLRSDRQMFRPLRAGTRILRLIVGRGHHRYGSPTPGDQMRPEPNGGTCSWGSPARSFLRPHRQRTMDSEPSRQSQLLAIASRTAGATSWAQRFSVVSLMLSPGATK